MLTHLRGWSRYDWLWIGWLVSFLAIEIPALLDARKGNTFSESWWWFLGIGEKGHKHAWVMRAVAFGFSCWLVGHLWSRKV